MVTKISEKLDFERPFGIRGRAYWALILSSPLISGLRARLRGRKMAQNGRQKTVSDLAERTSLQSSGPSLSFWQ